MNEKMTDETVRILTLRHTMNQAWTHEEQESVLAHIAALTDERDEQALKARACSALAAERGAGLDALRERVQALDYEVALMKERAKNSEEGRERAREVNATLQTRLAAIRQRAGDERRMAEHSLPSEKAGLVTRAIDRILSDKAGPSAPPEAFIHEKGLDAGVFDGDAACRNCSNIQPESCAAPLHCCGTTTDVHNSRCPTAQVLASLRQQPGTSAATTSETFATLRRRCFWPDARDALSLLERRMGAMERAVEAAQSGEMVKASRLSALAEAPPVFTVPTELAVLINGLDDEVRRAEEHHANKDKGGMAVPFHGDFASVPPSSLGRLRWWANALKGGRTSVPVFTLEEVEKAFHASQVGHSARVNDACNAMVERLTALRRTP